MYRLLESFLIAGSNAEESINPQKSINITLRTEKIKKVPIKTPIISNKDFNEISIFTVFAFSDCIDF
jgi:hypothetical protein